jgi:branched-chain amino acid transport system substrate-binding protein
VTENITRRSVLSTAVVAGAAAAVPLRAGRSADAIQVAMPCALTGALGPVGQQMKRGVEYFTKVQNLKGGLLGRPIEFIIEDTAGDPATCVRKAGEMVERYHVRLLMGMTLSSEALAVVPKLAGWNAIFVASDNGDGRLTTSAFVPNFFRANTSGPMDTRTVALWLRQAPYKSFYALGMDYAWGHDTVNSFQNLVKQANRSFLGAVFSPIGTKDFSSYILKIRQSGADAVFLVLAGDDNNAFLQQAHEYRLGDKMQLLTSTVDLASIRTLRDATLGLAGAARYCCTIDNPANRQFVADWQKAHDGVLPDIFEGEQFQACQIMAAGIEAAGSIEPEKLRPALEEIGVESIKGHVAMRACDHQAVQPGFMVKVEQVADGGLLPKIIDVFPADKVTPACRKETYDD